MLMLAMIMLGVPFTLKCFSLSLTLLSDTNKRTIYLQYQISGCLKNSFIFSISVYFMMSVVLECPKAIAKNKSMLDDNFKRNVLPGATYLNITFLLTKIGGKGLH